LSLLLIFRQNKVKNFRLVRSMVVGGATHSVAK
jgi:hypothetical protein